ncbi:MAG: tetratricopeptide repeat protein [Thermodesulfobacteriota bacterium]
MERERFENLIIEYIEGKLNRQEEDEFLSALTEHEEFREIYDQYLSIRNIIEKEDDISPSDEILKNIREYSKESVKKENPSIVKKWFSIPVLAPLLGTAIIAIFWFTVGDDYLKNKNIVNVDEVSSNNGVTANYQLRGNGSKPSGESVMAEEKILDLEINKFGTKETQELDAVASVPAPLSEVEETGKPDGYRDDKPNLQQEQQEIIFDKKGKSSIAGSSQISESEGSTGFSDKQSKDDLQKNLEIASESNAVLEEAVDDRIEKKSLKKESVGAQVATAKSKSPEVPEDSTGGSGEFFRQKVNDVLAQQYQGDCQNSIKLSNEVLNSKPEPPTAVQTTLYLSQAECYEELNQIDNAIKSYEKVQTIDPASTSFFSSKIRQLNMKKVK